MRSLTVVVVLLLVVVASNGEYWNQQCYPMTCVPQNIHISIFNESTLAVCWATLGMSATSTVKFGTNPDDLSQMALGNQSSYQHSEYNDTVLYNHATVIPNLLPATTYYYICGDSVGGFSPMYSFKTPPSTPTDGTPATPSRVIVYGDMGVSNGQQTASRVISLAVNDSFDFVFHIGDMSYADDYYAGYYEEVWNAWFTEMQPIMTTKPYQVCPGNHEYSCEHEGCWDDSVNFTAFLNRFLMPYTQSGAQNNMWFSFDYSNVHYIMVSTETDFLKAPEGPTLFGATQLQWLENDLAKANQERDVRPWIVVGGHRPIYCSSVGYSNSSGIPISDPANLQKAMEDLFYKYQVDIMFTGHVHAYERMYPVYANSATSQDYDNPEATVYVISGAAGNTEGLSNTQNSSWVSPTPNWSAHRYGEGFGYGVLNFYDDQENQQHVATWNFIRSLDNGIEDQFTITKDMA
jgi:hypothetical protein